MLEGSKVILKSIDYEDTDLIVKWRNSDDVLKYFFIQTEITNESHTWWLENKVFKGEVVQFVIVDKITTEKVGSAFLKDIDKVNLKAEYGIFLGETSCRGKGFGTEAASLICKYAFEYLGLNKIYLRVYADNIQAISSYKKCGFKEEGYLKDEVFANNKFNDVILMALLNKEERS